MGKLKKIDVYLILFIGIVLFYCLVLARYGFEFWDTGYIPSFSWRILNGQNAYEDFIYKGPPLTLYFHAFFMKILPEFGQFYWIRITNYLLFAIQVFLVVTAFNRLYSLKNIGINKWALLSICFVISLLNFPPYPWPTTDGLFFASIAFYILSFKSKSHLHLVLIALFSVLSALTKQSFYPVPIMFLGWILLNYGYKKAISYSLFLLVFVGLFLSWIASITSLSKFIAFTTGETTKGQLFYSGFLNYFWLYDSKWLYILIVAMVSVVVLWILSKSNTISFSLITKIFALVLVAFTFILCFTFEFLIASRMAMMSCFFGLLSQCNVTLKSMQQQSTVALLLGIAWCCSISLGYPFPILFSTGIILSLLVLFQKEIEMLKKYRLFSPIVILLVVFAFSYTKYPYREVLITKLDSPLGEISPKLQFITSSKSNLEKLKDLKNLKAKYGDHFIVAPNIAMAHYLFNSNSKMPADWLINSEINKNPKAFIESASNKENYVFLEKSFLVGEELMPEKRENFSIIAEYMYQNFNHIEETNYFIVLNGNKKNEPLPQIN
jgi:hypothetical protein